MKREKWVVDRISDIEDLLDASWRELSPWTAESGDDLMEYIGRDPHRQMAALLALTWALGLDTRVVKCPACGAENER